MGLKGFFTPQKYILLIFTKSQIVPNPKYCISVKHKAVIFNTHTALFHVIVEQELLYILLRFIYLFGKLYECIEKYKFFVFCVNYSFNLLRLVL